MVRARGVSEWVGGWVGGSCWCNERVFDCSRRGDGSVVVRGRDRDRDRDRDREPVLVGVSWEAPRCCSSTTNDPLPLPNHYIIYYHSLDTYFRYLL